MARKRLLWRLFTTHLSITFFSLLAMVWYAAVGQRIVWGAAVVALLAAVLSFLVAWRSIRPLENLKHGAARFAAGDLTTRLPVDDAEEFGSLAEALNQMAAQLDERIRTMTRQSHEREAILSSMTEGVLAVDTEERIISMNRSAARILGLSRADVQGRSIQEMIRNAQLQRFISRAMAAPAAVEAEIILRDGGERFLQVHGAILADASRRAIGAVIVLNDISRLRRLENIRTEFVANVSHELRTPITSIKGFVETLQDGAIASPGDARRFLNVIAKQVERLNAIIEDLLMLSQVEQEGETAIVLQREPLRAILDDAVNVCTLKVQEKHIDVQLDCSAHLVAHCNAALLEQAVVNLIDNALKYSESGKPIQVVAGQHDASVFIRVTDYGCGIAREHLPRLFERFYRVDKARSRKLGGTGLGLSIVKHIVQAHGGRTTVESAIGRGSTFTIRLPASPPVASAPEPAQTSAAS